MRRADRLLDLVARMRGGGRVRAEDLAAALEVSQRTVYRDIAALQAMGLPIEGAAGFGYLLRESVDLPPLTFSHEQAEALALGLAYVESVADADLALAARGARAKLDAVLPAARRGSLQGSPMLAVQREGRRAPALAIRLRRAIRQRQRLRLVYSDAAQRQSEREVQPLALTAFSEGWLLGGWCLLREDFRDFRLDRILSAEPVGLFEPQPGRDLAAYLARVGATAGSGESPRQGRAGNG